MIASGFEAGLTREQFWTSTPRTLWQARRGYHRRRAWLALHIAQLSRIDPRHFPSLAELSGEPESETEQPETAAAQQLHAVRMWKAIIARKGRKD